MKNDYVVLSVQFYNDKQNQFTGKYYDYLLDKQLYFKYRDSFMKDPFSFEITSGYNYRGSKVRAMEARNIRSNENVNDFKIIQDFWFTALINRGFCNETSFLTAFQDAIFKVGVTDTTSAVCNCDGVETTLSSKTAVDNSCYNNLSTINTIGLNSNNSITGNYINNSMYTWSNGNINSSVCHDFSSVSKIDNIDSRIDEIEKELETLKNNKDENEKENINMNKFGLNIKFGKVPTSEIRMSMYGPAFKSTDGWFANKDGEYINVDGFLFGEENYCYMLPATEDTLNLGDYILHNNSWCRVIDVDESGRLVVEKIMTHEVVTVIATKNVFGFEFYTKLMTIFGDSLVATKENPFGNMLPLMLMDGKSDMKDILMMSMLSGDKFDMSNPMMMMVLMGDGKKDMFEIMAMMQMMQMAQPKHKCTCNQQMKMEDM